MASVDKLGVICVKCRLLTDTGSRHLGHRELLYIEKIVNVEQAVQLFEKLLIVSRFLGTQFLAILPEYKYSFIFTHLAIKLRYQID